MTCIVGLVADGQLVIGGDSASTDQMGIQQGCPPKVFRNGEFIIGGAYLFRQMQLMQYVWTPPKFKEGKDVAKYIVKKVVPSIRDMMLDTNAVSRDQATGLEDGPTLLLGFHNRLFLVQYGWLAMESLENYFACGQGYQLALGVLAVESPENARTRVHRALRIAAKHCASVAEPFTVIGGDENV